MIIRNFNENWKDERFKDETFKDGSSLERVSEDWEPSLLTCLPCRPYQGGSRGIKSTGMPGFLM